MARMPPPSASPPVPPPGPPQAPPRWRSPFPPGVALAQAGPQDAVRHALLPGERALLGERAAPRRVLEFTLGRGCARAALVALAPEQAAALAETPILRADARRPAWPAGFVGAITHHRGHAAAAVARESHYRGLGLDLEALRMPSAALARRILRPAEHARWEALAPQEQAAAFMAVFSAKESVFKALYPLTGVYLGFQEAEVWLEAEDAPGSGRRALRWRLLRACGGDFPAGHEGPGCALLGGGYVLTAVWIARA
jgi:4'-phosphopantetheinyl transferase EntD